VIQGSPAAGVYAFAADADDLTIGEAPFLARSAIAGNDDYLRAIGRGAALDVKTAAADSGDLAVADDPLLVRAAVAVEQAHRCAVGSVAVRHVDAFAVVRADQLSRMTGNRVRQGPKDKNPEKFMHDRRSVN